MLRSRTLEAVAASLALAVALLITFSGDPGLEFLIFPAFVWIGLRLGVRAEAEIRRSEERYRRLVENMHDGLWATDADGRTTFMNDRMLELIGGTIDDYIGRDALAFAHPDDIPQIAADRDKRRSGKSSEYEMRLRRVGGSELWISLTAVGMFDDAGDYDGTLAICHDITDRKAADALRAELAAAVGGSADAIVTTTLDGRVRTWNPAAERIYGFSAAEVAGQVLDELVPSPDGHDELQQIQKRIAAGERVVQLDATCRRKGGRLVDLSLTLTPLCDARGTIIGITRFARDVTEHEADRRAVVESERRFRQIVETANEGVWVVDTEGRTVFVNTRMAEILGLTPEAMLGRAFFDYLVDAEPAKRRFANRAAGPERMELQMRHAGGHPLDVLVSTGPLRDTEGKFSGALAMVVDMTARRQAEAEAKELERQLNQIQRLETVGQLAGGIAHDFNNLLSVVLNYAEFALMTLDGHEARDDITEIKHAAERAAALTQQLLLFSRQEMIAPEVIDVNALIRSMHGLMARSIGEHVTLGIHTASTPLRVEADRSQLEQVLMNLAVNARDAMPDGGRLTIATSTVEGADEPWVRLSVSDTGQGMTDEVKQRLFEPFFTTKPKGSGTGLGLATVYGIVTSTGGRITVDSELGAGTTFKVDLRLTERIGVAESGELPALDHDGSHTVLVVEDEGAVRKVAIRILETAGFTVLAAAEGSEALDIAGDPETRIDAVLTDVVMPGMPGYVVAERLSTIRPETPVLFMSGYTDRMRRLPQGAVLIEKPFTSQRLVARVREAIEAGAR